MLLICYHHCFEVFCERPKSLKARAQTYSNYKHHNTVKFLIGIAPQGVITFVSKGWGGQVSDKHITEQCGIYICFFQDTRCWLIVDLMYRIVLDYTVLKSIAPFYPRQKAVEQMDVDFARRLSRVRIHVERVIALLCQKYTLLESTLPII